MRTILCLSWVVNSRRHSRKIDRKGQVVILTARRDQRLSLLRILPSTFNLRLSTSLLSFFRILANIPTCKLSNLPTLFQQSKIEHPIRMRVLSERSESKDLSYAVTPLECALTDGDGSKSFRIRSYEKLPGGVPLSLQKRGPKWNCKPLTPTLSTNPILYLRP